MSQLAALARCESADCSTLVLLPTLPDTYKKFDFESKRLEIVCPVCLQPFAISILEIAYARVTDSDLSTGYISIPSELH